MNHSKWKLFCFPYAGGSAAVFNPWKKFLDPDIELVAVELAGRGKRIYDPLYGSIEEAVEDIYSIIKNDLNGTCFAFFGHSMGGIIAFELAHKFRKMNLSQPGAVFFSGRGAPHVPKKHNAEIYHLLPEVEFREKVLELGGTPEEFFSHPELQEVLLPLLKNDFKMSETYKCAAEIIPFDNDIHVLTGKDEDLTAEQIQGWKEHTTQVCVLYFIAGGHFFLNEETEKIVSIINNTIRQTTII